MGSVVVRPTVEMDWNTLKTLRLEALIDSPHAFTATYEKTKTHSDSEWRDRAAQKTPCHYLLAFDEIRAIGMVGGIVDEQNEFNVVAMWVKPIYRASSVAALLISSVKQLAKQQGYNTLVLRVAHDNVCAIRFYLKQGFKEVSIFGKVDISETSLKMITSLNN